MAPCPRVVTADGQLMGRVVGLEVLARNPAFVTTQEVGATREARGPRVVTAPDEADPRTKQYKLGGIVRPLRGASAQGYWRLLGVLPVRSARHAVRAAIVADGPEPAEAG